MKHISLAIIIGLFISGLACSEKSQEAALDQLIIQLESESPAQKAYAAYLIGEYDGDRTKAIPALIETLVYLRPDYFVPPDSIKAFIGTSRTNGTAPGIEAQKALIKIGEPAVELLLLALKSTNIFIPRKAIYILGQIGDTRAIDPLIGLIRSDRRQISVIAVEALAQFGDTTHIDIILEIPNADENAWVRSNIPKALSHYHTSERARELLVEYLDDEHPGVRKEAAKGLQNNIHPSAYPSLFIAIVSSGSGSFGKVEAIKALAEANDSVATDYLIRALSTDDGNARSYIAQVLGNCDPEVAFDVLIELLDDPDFGVMMSASQSLGKIGDIRATEHLLRKVMEGERGISGHAALAIATLGDTSAVESLVLSLHSVGRRDDYAICKSLEKLTGEDIGHDPAKWISWYENQNE